jgi:ferrous iron transport protein B
MPSDTASEVQALSVALIGNPNTGKSTLFSALCGVSQRIGNYPGVTVEKKLGRFSHGHRSWTLIDLPGTYSLAPRSIDEMIAVDVLLGRREDSPAPCAVVCVVDATNLERNLYLVGQVFELGLPVVIALTMMDVARSRGITIDIGRLQERLGVPIVAVEAHRRRGLESLKKAVAEVVERPVGTTESPFPEPFRLEIDRLESELSGAHWEIPGETEAAATALPRYLIERLVLDSGGYLESRVRNGSSESLSSTLDEARKRLALAGCPIPAVEAISRYRWVGSVVEGVLHCSDSERISLSDRFDRVLTDRITGVVIFVALMALIFQAVFAWATPAMDAIDAVVGWSGEQMGARLPEGALRSLLVDGIVAGFGGVIVFLPQIAILFLFLGILEDCGYLARAAYLMDRLMTRVGLSGKSFIPLLSSFACAIPGIMATRVIEDRRDRLTTILVAPLMSCSARFPVYALLIYAFVPPVKLGGFVSLQGLTMIAMYAVGVLGAIVAATILKRTLFKGPTPPFVMELPAYKWPSVRVVLTRVVDRSWLFISRAGTMIVAVSVVMWVLLYYPRPSAEAVQAYEASRAEIAGSTSDSTELHEQLALLDARFDGAQKRSSLLGQVGRFIEPAVRPLGWDWRIGAAAIASFPAREVVVATLGVIFDAGAEVEEHEGETRLQNALHSATRLDGRPLFNLPVAFSITVFFALCAQCVSTLAVIRRETGSWRWPVFSFVYMTLLAYFGAMATYQLGMVFLGEGSG